MPDILKALAHLGRVHLSVAEDVFPRGATLYCATCGLREHATVEDCARYLARGWPTHCGYTMHTEPLP